MAEWRRHAIYVAPPRGHPLASFAAAWLGWDPEEGTVPPPPEVPGLPRPRAELAETPRRYGFHATLKAPFRLAEGVDAAALDAAAAAVAARCAPFALDLRLAVLDGFLALVPPSAPPSLAALEAACVTELAPCAAPSDAAALARRRATGLDAAEERNLRRWGYPWVLDRFRFHMTLTGRLEPGDRERTHAALAPILAPLVAAPLPVREICRFAEDVDGRFRLLSRHRFGGASDVKDSPALPPSAGCS